MTSGRLNLFEKVRCTPLILFRLSDIIHGSYSKTKRTQEMQSQELVRIPTPNTVGELLAILKQYPEEWPLYLYKNEVYDNGSEFESPAYKMSVIPYENIKLLSITFF